MGLPISSSYRETGRSRPWLEAGSREIETTSCVMTIGDRPSRNELTQLKLESYVYRSRQLLYGFVLGESLMMAVR